MATVNQPIASLPRLKELGLDPRRYATCSAFQKGRNAGCKYHPDSERDERFPTNGHACPFANTLQFMQPRDENDNQPRPRRVGTRMVRPSSSRPGTDDMRENWCECYLWHDDLAQRDGKNGLLCEIVAGEGEVVNMRDSNPEKNDSGVTVYQNAIIERPVPRFPDPTEVPRLAQDLAAARVRKSTEERKRLVERESRMGILRPEPKTEEEAVPVDAAPLDIP